MQSQSLVLSQKTLSRAACGAVMTQQFEVMATRDKSHLRMTWSSSSLQDNKIVVFGLTKTNDVRWTTHTINIICICHMFETSFYVFCSDVFCSDVNNVYNSSLTILAVINRLMAFH